MNFLFSAVYSSGSAREILPLFIIVFKRINLARINFKLSLFKIDLFDSSDHCFSIWRILFRFHFSMEGINLESIFIIISGSFSFYCYRILTFLSPTNFCVRLKSYFLSGSGLPIGGFKIILAVICLPKFNSWWPLVTKHFIKLYYIFTFKSFGEHTANFSLYLSQQINIQKIVGTIFMGNVSD